MIYKMTPSLAKELRKLLGECLKYYCIHDPDHGVRCDKAIAGCKGQKGRTFQTPSDAYDVMEALGKKSLWNDFGHWCFNNHCDSTGVNYDEDGELIVDWIRLTLLMKPIRLCVLAGTYLIDKQKGEKKR